MKKSLYILPICLLSVLMLLTACTDYDALLPTTADEPSPAERLANADSLFLNFRIVSNTHTTRATQEGTPLENAIYDGILCIFEGSSETNATLKTATAIDQLISNPNPSDATPRVGGMETAVNITQRLAEGTHAYGSNLYALVLLNTTESGFKVNGNRLYHNGNSQYEKTLTQVKSLPLNSVGSPDEHVGLFMSNAELVPINPANHLFDTEEGAADHFTTGHIDIPVERAAARIKVTNDIPRATKLSNIHLHGNSSNHPFIHKMTWALASELPGTDVATGATIFDLFHQHSHESGDAVYVPANISSTTKIVVELQLKEESFLLGDCYSFPSLNGNNLYTSVDELIAYYKNNWGWRYVYYPAIQTWSADDVFRNTKVTIFEDGSVKVSVLTDETASDIGTNERNALKQLENDLSDLTQGYREGKMYFIYSISSVERNNAYNLSLMEEGTIDTRYVTVKFKFDQGGINQTATFSNDCADLFTESSVVLGSNLEYAGRDATFEQTKIHPLTKHNSPDNNTDKIDFLFDPEEGWTFTPSSVSFNATRYGTDGGYTNVYWVNNGGNSTETLATNVLPCRNSHTPNVLYWSSDVSAGSVGDGECGLRLVVYNLKDDKQVGFSDIVIHGTLTKTTSFDNPQQSIGRVGQMLITILEQLQ